MARGRKKCCKERSWINSRSYAYVFGAFLFPALLSQATAQPQSTPVSTASASTASASTTPGSQSAPELSSHESAPTFKVNVRLVQVRVVVRDAHGNVVGNLRKEDFQLFDEGKPQVISKFEAEGRQLPATHEQPTASPPTASTGPVSPAPAVNLGEHFIAYVFDDVNLQFGDLARVRAAAQKNLDTLQPSDRAAIFTTSAQGDLDFTDDRNKLKDALLRLTPRPAWGAEDISRCPKMTYYIAYLIIVQGDGDAGKAMTADTLACQFDNDPRFQSQAASIAGAAAQEVFSKGNMQTRIALSSIKNIVHRVSSMPGQRSIVLVSPGFLTPDQQSDVNDIIDRAVNANVTISALDARGLYALVPGGEASQGGVSNPATAALIFRYQGESASADSDVMEEFADGTGGAFFQNSNDLEEGFRRVASTPEHYYVLGFNPQNLKLDGHFHKLKVIVNTGSKYSIQARKGYFAPKHATDPAEQAKQEIEEALFSSEEMHDLPVELQTQFFKPTDVTARLTVLARIDVRPLHFQKIAGRNNDNLTIVSGIFDRNGNFVTGSQKTLEMHLRDETLAGKLDSGLSVRSTFDVKPGGYLVRIVVRDEDGQIAAENGTIQIP